MLIYHFENRDQLVKQVLQEAAIAGTSCSTAFCSLSTLCAPRGRCHFSHAVRVITDPRLLRAKGAPLP